jgi:hypothetical protein
MQSRLLLLVLPFLATPATAGPPLAIGDPGVLEPGGWEVIVATTATSIGDGNYYQAPLLDVSLGLISETLQISAVYPFGHADVEDENFDSEFGNLEIGATWRFFQNEQLQLAFAPAYSFGVTRRTAEQGIGDFGDVASLPLVLEYQLSDRWRVNSSAGYEHVEKAGDALSYGAALAYGLSDHWEVLFELVGASNTDLEDDVLDARLGFDYGWNENFHLLFAVATGLREPEPELKMDYDVFFGMQLAF